MNIAARMGSWSTRHRRTAIIGWLLFVVIAVAIGGALGTKQLTNAENSDGQSAKAQQVLQNAGFDSPAAENVLVQARNGNADDAALRTAVAQVVAAVQSTGAVTDVHSPLDAQGSQFVSTDSQSMLVTFSFENFTSSCSARLRPWQMLPSMPCVSRRGLITTPQSCATVIFFARALPVFMSPSTSAT